MWGVDECLESCHWVMKIQAGGRRRRLGMSMVTVGKGGRKYEADVERKIKLSRRLFSPVFWFFLGGGGGGFYLL